MVLDEVLEYNMPPDIDYFDSLNLDSVERMINEDSEVRFKDIIEDLFKLLHKFFKQFMTWIAKNTKLHRQLFEKAAPYLDEYCSKVSNFKGYPSLKYNYIAENFIDLIDSQVLLQSRLILGSNNASSRDEFKRKYIDKLNIPSYLLDESIYDIISFYKRKLLIGNKNAKLNTNTYKSEIIMNIEDLNYSCIESYMQFTQILKDNVDALEDRIYGIEIDSKEKETAYAFCEQMLILNASIIDAMCRSIIFWRMQSSLYIIQCMKLYNKENKKDV